MPWFLAGKTLKCKKSLVANSQMMNWCLQKIKIEKNLIKKDLWSDIPFCGNFMTGIVKAFFVIIFVVLLFPLLLVFIEKKLKVHFFILLSILQDWLQHKTSKTFCWNLNLHWHTYEFLSLYRSIFILCCFWKVWCGPI